MPTSLSLRWHALAILVICGLVSLVYAPVTSAYYCGFDDFMDIHRAAFEDTQHPDHIWTTTHRGGTKYRPIYRLANDLTYWWGGGFPLVFHLRNLFFHCLALFAVYLMGLILFSWPVALAAALLFGLHPLTHQAVAVAGFYNAGPNAQFLLCLALFLLGYRARGAAARWVAIGAGVLSGALALFAYEPSVIAFGLIYCFLAIDYLWNGKRPTWGFLIALTLLISAAVGSYFLARSVFLKGSYVSSVVATPGIAVKNLTLYLAGLLLPFDSVLAHDWFGTPFPRYIVFTTALWVTLVAGAVALVAILWFCRRIISERLQGLPLNYISFLILATVSSLSLFLLFTDHASETYVAVPSAFFSLAVCAVLRQWFHKRPLFYGTAVGMLILLAALATFNRGERVADCGQIVARIMKDLPAEFRQGPATIWLSNFPGEEASYSYGIYGYKGLDTVGPNTETVEAALQVIFHNQQLRVQRVSPGELISAAREPRPGHHYYFVHSDGSLSPPRRLLF